MKADNLIKFQASSQEQELYQTVPLLSLLPKTHTLLTVCAQCEEVSVKHLKASRRTEWDGDGTSHSGGLVVKHVVATHNANNSRSNGRYQPCCPGAVEKLFIYFLCMPEQIIWTQHIKQEINQSIVTAHSFFDQNCIYIYIVSLSRISKTHKKTHFMCFFSCVNTNNKKHPVFSFQLSVFHLLFCFEMHFSLLCTY